MDMRVKGFECSCEATMTQLRRLPGWPDEIHLRRLLWLNVHA